MTDIINPGYLWLLREYAQAARMLAAESLSAIDPSQTDGDKAWEELGGFMALEEAFLLLAGDVSSPTAGYPLAKVLERVRGDDEHGEEPTTFRYSEEPRTVAATLTGLDHVTWWYDRINPTTGERRPHGPFETRAEAHAERVLDERPRQ